ncbi:hypothetical protein ACFL2K_02860 [Candidatus Margulisiibacteriota bacterium]
MKKIISLLILTLIFCVNIYGSEKISSTNTKESVAQVQTIGRKPTTPFVFGLSFLYPNPELASSIGIHLDYNLPDLTIGFDYHNGKNNVKTLSLGTYTMMPIYVLKKLPINKMVDFNIGAGYSFNSHAIDAGLVNYAKSIGYTDISESLKNSFLIILGLDIKFQKEGGMYSFKYYYNKTSTEASITSPSGTVTNSMDIDLSGLVFNVSFLI